MEWIPVDKKAPDVGQRILCTGLLGAVFVGSYKGCRSESYGRTVHLVGNYGDGERTKEIEAWMPAPEPYADLKKRDEWMRLRAEYYHGISLCARRRRRRMGW